VKLIALIFLFIWVRGTVPRLRMDQLMNFAWKFMLPMALINIGVAAVWHYMGAGWLRWPVCTLLLAGPYVMLGRGLLETKHISKRTYRFAD
jgi:NADH-quinone oxidoreductase subunit H